MAGALLCHRPHRGNIQHFSRPLAGLGKGIKREIMGKGRQRREGGKVGEERVNGGEDKERGETKWDITKF